MGRHFVCLGRRFAGAPDRAAASGGAHAWRDALGACAGCGEAIRAHPVSTLGEERLGDPAASELLARLAARDWAGIAAMRAPPDADARLLLALPCPKGASVVIIHWASFVSPAQDDLLLDEWTLDAAIGSAVRAILAAIP